MHKLFLIQKKAFHESLLSVHPFHFLFQSILILLRIIYVFYLYQTKIFTLFLLCRQHLDLFRQHPSAPSDICILYLHGPIVWTFNFLYFYNEKKYSVDLYTFLSHNIVLTFHFLEFYCRPMNLNYIHLHISLNDIVVNFMYFYHNLTYAFFCTQAFLPKSRCELC